MSDKQINTSIATLDIFRDQLKLTTDIEFGYAVELRDEGSNRPLLKGVGTSPKKAMLDLLVKWENG